ncbi:MAG: hypothetical protein NVSMB32_18090 [Actinomycetota bacterium]
MLVRNSATPDQGRVTIVSGGIKATLSCGSTTIGALTDPCTVADPGVFSPNPATGLGRAGSNCAGSPFSIVPVPGSANGELKFLGPTVTLDATTDIFGGGGGFCVIDFKVDVVRGPAKDASALQSGVQTAVLAVVEGITEGALLTGPLPASGQGTSITTIAPATPTLNTQASPTVALGGSIKDTATLAGGVNPTGTISFTFFGPDTANCTETPALSPAPVAVSGNGVYTSPPVTPVATGTYRTIATYSGDVSNAPVTTACLDVKEAVIVSAKPVPTLTTQASPAVTLGGSIKDTATLSGGVNPTGTIRFTFFGPNTTNCTETPAFSPAPVTVSGNGKYTSPPVTPVATGTYRTIATYSGDNNNAPVTTACLDVNESVVVTPPVITPSVLGESITRPSVTQPPRAPRLPLTGSPDYLVPLGALGALLLAAGGLFLIHGRRNAAAASLATGWRPPDLW